MENAQEVNVGAQAEPNVWAAMFAGKYIHIYRKGLVSISALYMWDFLIEKLIVVLWISPYCENQFNLSLGLNAPLKVDIKYCI